MTAHPNENIARKVNDAKRVNSPVSWAIGGVFLVALLGALFFYDGRDLKTKPGPNTPNVVNNPTGSK
jgi:hypothetical protein